MLLNFSDCNDKENAILNDIEEDNELKNDVSQSSNIPQDIESQSSNEFYSDFLFFHFFST